MSLRIGIVGQRGLAFLAALRAQDGVVVDALCDIDASTLARNADRHGFSSRFTVFEDLLGAVDAVVVSTPMHHHAAQSVQALCAGKHVLSEVTAAVSLDECWRLRDAAVAARKSGVIYAMAENYTERRECALIRSMCARGLFGELYYGEGEYLHEIRNYHRAPDGSPTWRHFWQVGARGNTYITHSLGPVMQWFRAVDPNDRIATIACRGTGARTDPDHSHDDTSITLCQLQSGKLITVRLDMMSNRPHLPAYYALQGTTGAYEASRIDGREGVVWIGESKEGDRRSWRPLSDFDEFLPDNWKHASADAIASGHGGGDWFVARDFVRACRGDAPPAVDIFDALEWTAAGLCSTLSIENDGAAIRVPDFRDDARRPAALDLPAPAIAPPVAFDDTKSRD